MAQKSASATVVPSELFSHSPTMNPLTVFIFFSLSKVELIKGNLQSVGLTLRLVQSTDGYAGHVIIETVAPNSPAALADLQRGDRLIAIGGNCATHFTLTEKSVSKCGNFPCLHSFYEHMLLL